MKSVFYLALVVVVLMVLVGCSGASTNPQVSVSDTGFSPAKVSTKAGGTVTWTNTDDNVHTVTIGTDTDSGAIQQSATYSQKFDVPGSFDYYCRYHPSETGRVDVR